MCRSKGHLMDHWWEISKPLWNRVLCMAIFALSLVSLPFKWFGFLSDTPCFRFSDVSCHSQRQYSNSMPGQCLCILEHVYLRCDNHWPSCFLHHHHPLRGKHFLGYKDWRTGNSWCSLWLGVPNQGVQPWECNAHHQPENEALIL